MQTLKNQIFVEKLELSISKYYVVLYYYFEYMNQRLNHKVHMIDKVEDIVVHSIGVLHSINQIMGEMQQIERVFPTIAHLVMKSRCR